jgi:hypothetical protein
MKTAINDFESIDAIDLELFNDVLVKLLITNLRSCPYSISSWAANCPGIMTP